MSPLYGTAVSLPFPFFPHSAIAREQSIVKVSVYTLQFMFIKIKWETRERRRWEEGEAGHTRHTHACAVRNAKNLCIKLVPFGMRGEGGRTTNCAGTKMSK